MVPGSERNWIAVQQSNLSKKMKTNNMTTLLLSSSINRSPLRPQFNPHLKQIMKNKSASRSVLICLFAVLTFAVCTLSALAQNCPQRRKLVGPTMARATGSPVRTGAMDVRILQPAPYINNAGTAQINRSGAVAKSLTLGLRSGEFGHSLDRMAPIVGPWTWGRTFTSAITAQVD